MHKEELITKVATKLKKPKYHVEVALNGILAEIKSTLKKGQPVQITGFGRFYANKQKKRKFHDISTGKMVEIKARRVARFTAGRHLREAVR